MAETVKAGSASAAAPSETTKGAVDPRTGEKFADQTDKHGGRVGFDGPSVESGYVPNVDPARIPAEVTPGVMPDAGNDKLLAAAQAAAPNLTKEFVAQYEISDEELARIARREVPPPPSVGPIRSSDLYLTPGGWQNVPPGVKPEDVGKNSGRR
jgi:hypothetical protein